MGINWNGKRRYIALLLLIAGFVIMFTVPPVLPVIQLPGEVYPAGWNFLGLQMTNTLMSSIIVWILIGLLALYIRWRMPKNSHEVPRAGFYNLLEMAFDGLYGFVLNIAGEKWIKFIFSMFFTIFIVVLLSNWQSLVPGVDSIGFLHAYVGVEEESGELIEKDGYEVVAMGAGVWRLNPACPWVSPLETATYTEEQKQARINAGCMTGTGIPIETEEHVEEVEAELAAVEAEGGVEVAAAESIESAATADATEAAVLEASAEGESAVAAGESTDHSEEAAAEGEEHSEEVDIHNLHFEPGDPAVPWQITPFVRPASTDLNMTLALALVAVVATQIIGFRELGPSYLTKFFNFRTLFSSPLGGIDVAVGLLELIGEFARILSFAFRLLGNVFAGSVLLFVMSYLIPFLPWPFFILEFFVGAIQAIVFALLTAIFMNLATQGHGAEHHEAADEDHHGELPAEASNIGETVHA